jgi:DNA-directed RNA polymerase specialized sigma24 family protein
MTIAHARTRVSLPLPRDSSPPQPLHAGDLALVRRVLAGDLAAWQSFVERYAGLILAMARRYLRSQDQDDIRTVFVSVLESLRKSRLRTYEGRASLATWLALVARSEVMDLLRRRFGRDPKMKSLSRLAPEERTLFKLYYIDGLPRSEVMRKLAANGGDWTDDRFIAALDRIERQLGDRWLRRLSYDLHAQSIGASSGRLLEYLDHVRDEYSRLEGTSSPEFQLMEREARRSVEQLRANIARLNARDRRLIELRFENGWTAGRIAAELGMNGQRSVYRAVERLVVRLRRRLQKDGIREL